MLPTSAIMLLPQQAPFQMVDTLVFAEEGHFISHFSVKSENVMVFQDEFSEGGLLENMAQTSACGTGYFYSSQGKSVPVGYIGAIKNIQLHRNPQVGDSLETEVIIKNQIGGASIAAAKVMCNGNEIASCELTIFIQSNS